jgi:3-oxoadipate enol-lactonase
MPTADIGGGVTLEYESTGSGPAVVLIHGAFISDTFTPLISEPALAGQFNFIRYSRRGYAESSHTSGISTVQQQAADCLALLNRLSVRRAHVLGHSYGGCVALQMALNEPERVHTLAVLEPALMIGESAGAYRDALLAGTQRYRSAGASTALDESLRARWPEYRDRIGLVLPTALEQAMRDAVTSFESELPGLLDWTFSEEQAARCTMPTLAVLGGKSNALWPRFGETQNWLLLHLPDCEGFVLDGATHFLHVEDSHGMAEGLRGFWARHPIA